MRDQEKLPKTSPFSSTQGTATSSTPPAYGASRRQARPPSPSPTPARSRPSEPPARCTTPAPRSPSPSSGPAYWKAGRSISSPVARPPQKRNALPPRSSVIPRSKRYRASACSASSSPSARSTPLTSTNGPYTAASSPAPHAAPRPNARSAARYVSQTVRAPRTACATSSGVCAHAPRHLIHQGLKERIEHPLQRGVVERLPQPGPDVRRPHGPPRRQEAPGVLLEEDGVVGDVRPRREAQVQQAQHQGQQRQRQGRAPGHSQQRRQQRRPHARPRSHVHRSLLGPARSPLGTPPTARLAAIGSGARASRPG